VVDHPAAGLRAWANTNDATSRIPNFSCVAACPFLSAQMFVQKPIQPKKKAFFFEKKNQKTFAR
jgi:hypothetical protein